MSLLKILPAVIALGTVAVIAVGVDLMMSDTTDISEDSVTKKEVLTQMKQLQNELARLSDLKMINDKREATTQVNNIELNINGVEINELISTLSASLDSLTAQYNQFD